MRELHRLHDALLVLSIIALWAAIQLPAHVENVLGYFLILSIGVGHGANDVKIYFRDKKISSSRALFFIVLYAITVLLGFAAFFIIPSIVLAVFIVVSGYHFGQEHFEHYKIKDSYLLKSLFTSYGLAVIVTLLYVNHKESIPIISNLINRTLPVSVLAYTTYLSVAFTVALGFVILRNQKVTQLLRELFYLAVLLVIFNTSSLVWGFAIYFILWHSVPSINHQIHHLYGEVNKETLLHYAKASFLYWIAALIFLAGLYYLLYDRTTLFLTIVVAFLGGITFPHVLVMNNLNTQTGKESV